MTSKPRILVVFPSTVVYGAERGNIEALCAMRDQGAEILCLVRDDWWAKPVPVALGAHGLSWLKSRHMEGLRRNRVAPFLVRGSYNFVVGNFQFLRAMRSFKPTHIHAFNQFTFFNFWLSFLLLRTPVVFRAGDEPTLHNWFGRATWALVVRRTSQYVANSRFVADSLTSHGVEPERINLIYNAPPSRGSTPEAPLGLALPPSARLVAFVGQIAEHKGPHYLIEAFEAVMDQYPQVHLVLAGRISDWEGDAWGRQLRDRTLSDASLAGRVHFLGEIEGVPELMTAAEVVVVPSLFHDPSPNVVMEAKQAGRAVIGFPRGGISELIENGVNGILCSEPTVEALREALSIYLSDPGLARDHGAASRLSLDRLGVPQFRQKWAEVYVKASLPAGLVRSVAAK